MVISICVLLVTTLQCVLSQPLPLSEADIQELVSAHNFFRGMVDPPASNMQRVVSSNRLLKSSIPACKAIYLSHVRHIESVCTRHLNFLFSNGMRS